MKTLRRKTELDHLGCLPSQLQYTWGCYMNGQVGQKRSLPWRWFDIVNRDFIHGLVSVTIKNGIFVSLFRNLPHCQHRTIVTAPRHPQTYVVSTYPQQNAFLPHPHINHPTLQIIRHSFPIISHRRCFIHPRQTSRILRLKNQQSFDASPNHPSSNGATAEIKWPLPSKFARKPRVTSRPEIQLSTNYRALCPLISWCVVTPHCIHRRPRLRHPCI